MSKYNQRGKKKSNIEYIEGEVTYEAISRITIDSNPREGKSTMKECVVELNAHPQILAAWHNDNGITAEGLKAQTQALIQGLNSNIHYGHQFKLRDSAEHLRYIIEHLEKGFLQSQMKAFKK